MRYGRLLDAVVRGWAVRFGAQVDELTLSPVLAIEDHARIVISKRLDVEVDGAREELRCLLGGHSFIQRHGSRWHALEAREFCGSVLPAHGWNGRLHRSDVGRHRVRCISVGSGSAETRALDTRRLIAPGNPISLLARLLIDQSSSGRRRQSTRMQSSVRRPCLRLFDRPRHLAGAVPQTHGRDAFIRAVDPRAVNLRHPLSIGRLFHQLWVLSQLIWVQAGHLLRA